MFVFQPREYLCGPVYIQKAVTDYDKVIHLGPHHDHALYNQGNTLVEMGCYKKLEKKGRCISLVADNRRELEKVIDKIGAWKYECN